MNTSLRRRERAAGPRLLEPPAAMATDEEIARVWRDDIVAAVLSATVIAGLYLDGWNHLNLQQGRLGSFFTPWHGLLYAGFTANAVWVISRNRHLWRHDLEVNPHYYRVRGFALRYPFAVGGLVLVFVGMVGDLVWHTVLGEETDVARVIAPFHVILFLGSCLLIAAPLRSAWQAPEIYPADGPLSRLAPAVMSLTLLSAAAAFLLQWLSPFMEWQTKAVDAFAAIVPVGPGLQNAMAARVVLANMVLGAPILLALRRWILPLGTATILYTTVAFAMSALTSFDLVWTALAAVAGGVATDLAIRATARSRFTLRLYAVAAAAPLVCWPVYFAILRGGYGAHWPADFAVGTAFYAALVALGVAFLLSMPGEPGVTAMAPVTPGGDAGRSTPPGGR